MKIGDKVIDTKTKKQGRIVGRSATRHWLVSFKESFANVRKESRLRLCK